MIILFFISISLNASDTIRIASIFAHSGKATNGNFFSTEAVRIIVDKINKEGGVLGKQIELIQLDNKSTAIGSMEAAIKAVRLNVSAVIGASWSSHSLAMADILQKNSIPMISNYSTNPDVTKKGNFIYRVCFIDTFQSEAISMFAYNNLKAKKIVILENISSANSISLTKEVSRSFSKFGGEVLGILKYKIDASNFSELINKIKELNPDVVVATGKGFDSSLIIEQSKQMGLDKIFIGSDGWSKLMFQYTKNLDGNYFISHWHKDTENQESKKIYPYLKHLGGGAFLSYDALMVLVDAIKRANSSNPIEINKALSQTKNFKGSTGTITFDKNGDPLNKDSIIVTFKGDKIKYVTTVKPN